MMGGRLLVVLLVALGLFVGGCRKQPPKRVSQLRTLAIPRATSPIEIDGESEEEAWHHAARTGPFLDETGQPMRPFSEAMFARDEHTLYVHLYAADDDLRSPVVDRDGPLWLCDRFRLIFHGGDVDRVMEVTPRAALGDALGGDRSWDSGLRVATDTDGTIDDPGDEDEEWVAELAVPLSALGPIVKTGRLPITIERIDVGGQGPRRRLLPYATILAFQ